METTKPQNILNNRRTLITIAALTGFLLTAIGFGLYWAPDRIARFIVFSEAERKAEIWQSRVLRLLERHEATFETAVLNKDDETSLSHFVASSDVFRLRLFDENGKLFWSSRGGAYEDDDRHSIGDTKFFRDSIILGTLYHESVEREARFIEGFRSDHMGSVHDEKEIRLVSEIYIPVLLGGRVIGVIEHYRDITDDLNVTRVRFLLAAITISAAFLIMWITAVASFYLHQKHNRSFQKRQREQERAAAAYELQRSREISLFSELNEWLQSCKTLDELYLMVSSVLSQIFPDCSGSIYVYSNSRDVLEGACEWNGCRLEPEIRPDDCWGLRRGRMYAYGSNEIDFMCSHADKDNAHKYVCIPIIAHGDTIGLMHLVASSATHELTGEPREFDTADRKRALMCAEQISLAIANVRLRDQLHNQSIRDSLTGLYNRRFFTEACRKQIVAAKRRGEPFGLISFDVDHFKTFNDNHGHDAGDMVLRAVGDALQREFDDGAMPCRIGGEEFVVLLPEHDELQTTMRAEKLRKMIEAIVVRYGDHDLPRITVSAGVAIYPEHGDMPQSLVKSSDEALYNAKALGRNQVYCAMPNTIGNESDDDGGVQGGRKGSAGTIAA